MNIIIDAAAQTQDCYPLTVNKPNALMSVFNKTLLEHALSVAAKKSNNIIIQIQKIHAGLFQQIGLPDSCQIATDYILQPEDVLMDARHFYWNDEVFTIHYAWDLIKCQEKYAAEVVYCIDPKSTIEPLATLKGNVTVGAGTIIKNGVYIEGPVMIGENCTIGPNCYIRGNTSIGNNCRIGNAVEVKNAIIGRGTNICHLSYFGDGIAGDRVNLGAGFINANLRHDAQEMTTMLNGNKVPTGRNKLGAIIGDDVHTGINSLVYPGRKIWPHLSTNPGEIVSKDIL
ncbi:DapH/DapD/GlmU-related protein [Pedobacter frigoris]|uniref:Mannose-1-phosphate guanyltransferase C-terminal domain-containing protein n=1 Tax=Pedobacter frigoris TaxID=2571272 RepID=A0A4U1CSI5_9SPHI|nr:DapH/DapD/GlmU-related protein [Pedobacter frigoris]TKC08698.1 hypothetical protein FA047_00950 [Pedobacter frigoris]